MTCKHALKFERYLSILLVKTPPSRRLLLTDVKSGSKPDHDYMHLLSYHNVNLIRLQCLKLIFGRLGATCTGTLDHTGK